MAKEGKLTSEFAFNKWVALVIGLLTSVAGALITTGVVPDGSPVYAVATIVVAAAGALGFQARGYSKDRTEVKTKE